MGLNPKKCSYPLKPPKSAQTLKKRSGMAESVSNQGFARKKCYNGISRLPLPNVALRSSTVVQTTSEKFLRASCTRWFRSSGLLIFHGTWDVDPKWLDIFGAGRNRNHQAVKWFWALKRNISRFLPGGIASYSVSVTQAPVGPRAVTTWRLSHVVGP